MIHICVKECKHKITPFRAYFKRFYPMWINISPDNIEATREPQNSLIFDVWNLYG